MIAVVSGSVALMSDTIHNLGDALTSIPLWIAFALGRRGPTRSYSYGFHRAEDLAGLVIVAAIGLSAVLIVIESLGRFVEPRLMGSVPWVIAAGLIRPWETSWLPDTESGSAIGSAQPPW